ncbi:MAG: hypothetical protein SP1CHLAM54_10160 [Chlamydiia bacterium]|nr:hypothetical protein [Chlamydiia bacterium]MCH9615922.1 hypothetical protein [Chlamydiia bacterium]MCH9628675.1 hypothetical protein [Chlamydiia bacterium]
MKLGLLFACIGTALFGFNQEVLDGLADDFAKSWNLYDGKSAVKHFSDDACFVNIFGMRFDGKEAIEDRHVEILTTFLKGSTYEVTGTDYQEVAPGVVVGHINWKVEGFRPPCCGPEVPGKELHGTFTQVFVETDGIWKIVSSQNTMQPLKKNA